MQIYTYTYVRKYAISIQINSCFFFLFSYRSCCSLYSIFIQGIGTLRRQLNIYTKTGRRIILSQYYLLHDIQIVNNILYMYIYRSTMNRDHGNLPQIYCTLLKYLSIVVFVPSRMCNVRMRSLSPSLCSLSPDEEDTWRGVKNVGIRF